MNNLLARDALERSATVANCVMNRARGCAGGNSYARELHFDLLAFLKTRLQTQAHVSWLDLCCGQGKAMLEAARHLASFPTDAQLGLVGVDLIPGFDPCPTELCLPELHEASVLAWQPNGSFDLITCVHGLHYIGDKLGLLQKAAAWLKSNGIFLANLDLRNLKFPNGKSAGRKIVSELRSNGFDYQSANRLVVCRGRKNYQSNYRYLGADDAAGPNYTGQPAVDSYYQPSPD